MKAVLLAGGFGTRLQEYTKNSPKCLVEINERPLLDIWLEKLHRIGVNKFLINTHYLAEKVENFISEHRFSNKIEIFHEETILGTAGTLNANQDFIDEDTFIIHADNYCEDDLFGFVEAHKNRPMHCLGSLLTFITDDPRNCGIVKTDSEKVLINFYEKVLEDRGNIASGALFLITEDWKKEFGHLFSSAFDISRDLVPYMYNKLLCYLTKETYIDIGTPDNLQLAKRKAKIKSLIK